MDNIIEEEKKYFEFVKESLEKEKEKCNKDLIEIPKKYTRTSQGDSFLVQDLMSMAATKLRKLESVEKSPYFGRIDFLEDEYNKVTKIYIGKTNISSGINQQSVIDWRTPICSLYYENDVGNASYESPDGTIHGELKLKRQIIIKDNIIVDILDTNAVSNDELLRPYLSVNADNKMKNIIASIQREQNHIIRIPINQNIIVQGVAGSGKTSVAMHRIAYLIYNLRGTIKSRDFIVIGPNKCFLDYISSILPDLETDPVDQFTYIELVNNFGNEKLALKDENLLNYKNIDKSVFKKIQKYKLSLEYEQSLKKFMDFYLNNYIVSNGIVIDGEEIYSAEEIKSRLFSTLSTILNFKKASEFFANDFKENMEFIYFKLNQKYSDVYSKYPKGHPLWLEAVEKSANLSTLVKKNGIQIVKNYFKKLNLKISEIYKLFIDNIETFDNNLSEDEIYVLKQSVIRQKNLLFEDLAALLYIDSIIHGVDNNHRHVIIDEAQDYGIFHFDALKKKFPNCTFSIFGDLAQSIYSYKSIENWESVIHQIFNKECSLLNLSKSYRTTIEITNNANKLLDKMNLSIAEPVIRHGVDVLFSQNCSNNIEYKVKKIEEWVSKGYKSIAVICKTEKEVLKIYPLLDNSGININMITSKNNEYKGGICIISSSLAKGLEFDAVIINDASNDIYFDDCIEDMHLLYIACTRALHELDINYNKRLCDVFQDSTQNNINNNKKLSLHK